MATHASTLAEEEVEIGSVIDLGITPPGTPKQLLLTIKNSHRLPRWVRDLKIHDNYFEHSETSCLTGAIDRDRIEPGESATLTLTLSFPRETYCDGAVWLYLPSDPPADEDTFWVADLRGSITTSPFSYRDHQAAHDSLTLGMPAKEALAHLLSLQGYEVSLSAEECGGHSVRISRDGISYRATASLTAGTDASRSPGSTARFEDHESIMRYLGAHEGWLSGCHRFVVRMRALPQRLGAVIGSTPSRSLRHVFTLEFDTRGRLGEISPLATGPVPRRGHP
jgi:hypothetical protein